ncbi:MAG: HNH endonuclease [Methylococcales bacterium]|nr:HNH endonuclease [Methylococcales bacterium]
MTRKQFIESQGATCDNWTWSWSFKNESEKFIIFGAWDVYDDGNLTLIFSEDWSISRKGKGQAGYSQSREHIRLIEEKGYQLKTFPMEYTAADEKDEGAPAKIKGFTPKLSEKKLFRIGNNWYASSDQTYGGRLAEEVDPKEVFKEGASKTVTVNQYERSAVARSKCLEHNGYKCAVCSFNFENMYGEIGKKYIHVHHIVPISEIGREYELNPVTDLIPICPNCHAMIHITRPALSIEQLKKIINNNENSA